MNILHSLYLLVPLLHLALAGPFFKAGFIKGALKGLLKGQNQKSDDRQCQVKWEEVWKPHCSTSYEQVCRNEPQQECSTEYREECWTEERQQCTTEYERVCSTSYQQQCETEYEEECWEETEEECFHEQDCSEPEPVHTYSDEGSRHKRSASHHEEELQLT